MRPEHLLNFGYTPTCQAALERLADLLLPSGEEGTQTTRLFDPCCGDGAALAYLGTALAAKGAIVKTYGVEIEENRAEAAAQHLDHVIQGDFRRLAMSHRSISLILANPPYDNAGGEASLEKTIIRRCLPYLAEGGALALVIPERLLAWAEAKLKFRWLALFPSQDPDSPNQFVLLGQVAEEPHPLPIPGADQRVQLPAPKNGVPIFRVTTLTDEERQQVLTSTPLPVLYPDIAAEGNQVIHPLRAGHRAAYLAGYGATIPLTEGFLRVAVCREEIRKEVDEKTTKIIQAPRMTSYLLSSKGLEELPFEELPKLAQEIDAALAMQTYVEEDEHGWPVTALWEDQVLAQINARLPEMQGRRGLLPPQAVRAIGMTRALLAGEKAVYGVMEMGWGKTVLALAVRELLMACKHIGLTIVLCPPHLMKKWKREAKRLAPDNLVLYPEGNGEKRLSQVFRALNVAAKGTPVILILSREMVKLGPLHKPQLARHFFPHHGYLWICPHCGALAATDSEPGWGRKEILRYAQTFPALSKDAVPPRRLQNKTCPACGVKYAGPETTPRRWPLAEVIYRAVKRGQIRNLCLIADEVHEYRNASLQGTAFSRLFRVAKWAILLTGTLYGGKASDLYRLLRWTSPELRRTGLGEREFVKKYGYMEAVETRDEKRSYGRKVHRSAFRERPGVSPTIYRFLLPRTAFGALRDVAVALPDYTEENISLNAPALPVEGVFCKNYGGQLYHEKGKGAFMAWLRAALGYYNIAAVQPSGNGHGSSSHIYSYTTHDEDGECIQEEIVLDLPFANSNSSLPKEAELLSIIKNEKAEHRKAVVLLEQTITRPLPTRLIEILNAGRIRATYLDTSRVAASEREEWIEKHAYDMDVLITHPRAVETGLDLVMFQTVVVYEAIYAVISLAQAVARVWRLGQNQPVRVFSLAYEDNLEQDAWRVIAKKIAWSKSVYGDFIPSGLGDAGLDENLDLLSALTEAIAKPETGNRQVDEMAWLQTNLAGIERNELSIPLVPQKISVSNDASLPAPVATLEEWLLLYGKAIDNRSLHQRRKVDAPKAQLSLF